MMPLRFFIPLILLTFPSFSASGKQLANPQHVLISAQLIAACEQKTGENRFHLHRCLLQEFETLQKKTDMLTDRLLGMVGAHRSFGRLKIIQWSNAITKSQSRWQKMVPWDCEWEGHILPSPKGASVAIDRCGIKRAAKRVQLLETRVKTLTIALETATNKKR